MQLEVSPRTAAQLLLRLSKAAVARAADKEALKIRALFLRACRAAQDVVPLIELEDVLTLGHPGTGAVLHALASTFQTLTDGLADGVVYTFQYVPHLHLLSSRKKLYDVMLNTLHVGAKASPFKGELEVTNPEAIAWAEREAAQLVKDIDDTAKAAIRAVVVESFEAGINPHDVARIIRKSIGLTERDAGAVMNRQLKLLADGVSSARASAKAKQYADTLLRRRADTIALNEAMRASAEGQRQLWHRAESKGLLTGRERKMLIQVDPCPICAPMATEIVGINDDFSQGLPPFHVRCRCVEGLVA